MVKINKMSLGYFLLDTEKPKTEKSKQNKPKMNFQNDCGSAFVVQ